ncbi:hypothetical protein F5Y07DRAFT_23036 [Xylaria sp. FL0933]|nr:hypothetical protein F5Y07DRAFT_23036 [Xylaria sp. FL0933]
MQALQTTLQTTAQTLRATPATQRVIYTTAATATVALLAYSRHCYVEWLALGEGGIPASPFGWLINCAAHLVARRDERAVPAPYEKPVKPSSTSSKPSSKSPSSSSLSASSASPLSSSSASSASSSSSATTSIVLSAKDEERYGEHSKLSFFSFPSSSGRTNILPPRNPRGIRPVVPTTVVPQRQTTEKADGATVSRMNAYIARLAASNPALFKVKPSALESPNFPALWLSPSSPSPSPSTSTSTAQTQSESKSKGEGKVEIARAKWLPKGAPGEIAHVHHEGSTHVCLSLTDAAEVVRQGWGERHKLSGVGGILPWGYVLIYAPREENRGNNEDDWEVWKGLVDAGARCVARCAGFEGEVVVPE